MAIKFKKKIKVVTKKINNSVEQNSIIDESKISYYKTLKEKLKANFKKEIVHKVENIRILKEIKDNKYYKLDGYRSFDAFTKEFYVAKSQAYKYLKLAAALQDGVLNENYVIENGIHNSFNYIKDKESPLLKKSKQNPVKPLRLQLKTQEIYDFYKSNSKFTNFMMNEIFENQKDLIHKLMKKYAELKI
ncbi:chromosome replication/partitioning protein [Borreliella japonica]|uniref:Putative plasmid partition protein n=4 Tax=Borreliella TaxID=64895 RepID=A0A1G4QIY1_BORJA|nr:chromosome replication/partitioning protein [Borreliella japonica]SCW44405.1 Putative plasmid partition protein [Borreliella japonica]